MSSSIEFITEAIVQQRFEASIFYHSHTKKTQHYHNSDKTLFVKTSAFPRGHHHYDCFGSFSRDSMPLCAIGDEPYAIERQELIKQYYSNSLLNALLKSAFHSTQSFVGHLLLIQADTFNEKLASDIERLSSESLCLVSCKNFSNARETSSLDGLPPLAKQAMKFARLLGFVDLKEEHCFISEHADSFYFIDLMLAPGTLEYLPLQLDEEDHVFLAALIKNLPPESIKRPDFIDEEEHLLRIMRLKATMHAHLNLLSLKTQGLVDEASINTGKQSVLEVYPKARDLYVEHYVKRYLNPDYIDAFSKKCLICISPYGVYGELSMTLSLAESWVLRRKTDFNLAIYIIHDSLGPDSPQIRLFERRFRHLATKGINIEVFNAPSGQMAACFEAACASHVIYTTGIIYPLPNFSKRIITHAHEALVQTRYEIYPSKTFSTTGLANFKPFNFHDKTGCPNVYDFLPEESARALQMRQPPCFNVSEHEKPVFLQSIAHYYCLYVNSKLVSEHSCGVTYKDALLVFIIDSLEHRPTENVWIFFNNASAANEHRFEDIADGLCELYPNLIIEFEYLNDRQQVRLKQIQTPDAKGPKVTIKTFPKLAHSEFLGLILHAEIAALNGAGSLDEALALARPCLMINNFLMNRTERFLSIISAEPDGNILFPNLHAFLSHHRIIETTEDKFAWYHQCLTFFNNPKHRVLSHELAQFKRLIDTKYPLSEILYNTLNDASHALTPTPSLAASEIPFDDEHGRIYYEQHTLFKPSESQYTTLSSDSTSRSSFETYTKT